jgi:hypothetical protein
LCLSRRAPGASDQVYPLASFCKCLIVCHCFRPTGLRERRAKAEQDPLPARTSYADAMPLVTLIDSRHLAHASSMCKKQPKYVLLLSLLGRPVSTSFSRDVTYHYRLSNSSSEVLFICLILQRARLASPLGSYVELLDTPPWD